MKTARLSILVLFFGLVVVGCQRDPTGLPVVLEVDTNGCSTPSSAEWAGIWTVDLRFTVRGGRPGCRTETCQFGDVNAFPTEAAAISHCVSLLGYTEGGK